MFERNNNNSSSYSSSNRSSIIISRVIVVVVVTIIAIIIIRVVGTRWKVAHRVGERKPKKLFPGIFFVRRLVAEIRRLEDLGQWAQRAIVRVFERSHWPASNPDISVAVSPREKFQRESLLGVEPWTRLNHFSPVSTIAYDDNDKIVSNDWKKKKIYIYIYMCI